MVFTSEEFTVIISSPEPITGFDWLYSLLEAEATEEPEPHTENEF